MHADGTIHVSHPPTLTARCRAGARQAEIPAHFRNRWMVAAWTDEDPMGHRECEVLRYEVDEEGRDVVRVRFLDRRDLFEPETATYTPWQLLPAQRAPAPSKDLP